jgi:hypothetical protein
MMSEAKNAGSLRRLVRRLSDGKVLPVVDEQGEEICVEELFPFGDGGPSPRPLRLWHKRSLYVPANVALKSANEGGVS